jgi:hypothetical protein
MNLSKHFNILMASAVSFSLAASPLAGVSVAHAQNAPAAEAPGDAGWQKEFEAWRSASKAGTVADYESYLRAYPTGKFASVAKKRIDDLNGAKTADTQKVDEQKTADVTQSDTTQVRSAETDAEKKRDLEMWRQVSKTGTQADYEKYLKAFPKGKFARVAKTRIEGLIAKAKAPVEQDTVKVVEQPAQQDEVQAQTETEDQAAQPEEKAQVTQQAVPDEQPEEQDQTTVQADDQPADQGQAPETDWEKEYALWKAASQGNTVTEYEAYLKNYPKGKFAAIAQARIVQLSAAEQPVANIAEGDDSQDDQNNTVNQTAGQQDDQADEPDQAQNQGDDQNQDQMDQAAKQPDDQQTVGGRTGADDNMGQDSQPDQNIQFTEGTPDTEDQFMDREARHEIQGRLTSLGYDTAGTDGSFGPRTRTAITGWQQDNGAPISGYLSGDQIEQIRKMSEVSYAEWLNSQPVQVVRPRREKIIVEDPALDAAVAVGVVGTVVGVQKFKRLRPHNRVKVVGKLRVKRIKMGNCRKRRRC